MTDPARDVHGYDAPRIEDRADIATPLVGGGVGSGNVDNVIK